MVGFDIDGNGDVWVGLNGFNVIMCYLMMGFDLMIGKLLWGKLVMIVVLGSVVFVMCIIY